MAETDSLVPAGGESRRPAATERPSWRKARYALLWLRHGQGKRAALALGVEESKAVATAKRMHADPYVRRLIREGMRKRREALEIDARFVLEELVALYRATSIAELIALEKDPEGNYRYQHRFDLEAAPTDVLHAVQSMRIGDDGAVTITMPDRIKLLELIGKHIDVSAWEDRLQVELRNAEDVVSRLHEGRKRVAEARARLVAKDGVTIDGEIADDAG